MSRPSAIALAFVATLSVVSDAFAQAPTLRFEPQDDIYAGRPFNLALYAQGFDSEPEPIATKLEIPGCRVQFLGVSKVRDRMNITVNGRRMGSGGSTIAFVYRVEAPKARSYTISPIAVE